MCRSEEHTSELQSLRHLVCRLLLEKKKKQTNTQYVNTVHRRLNVHRASHTRLPCTSQRIDRPHLVSSFFVFCFFFFFFFLKNRAPPEISPFPLPAAFPF